jgi:hypothetical protein
MKDHTTTNRLPLALFGLVLLAGGLTVLTAGAGVYQRWNLTPPGGWPLTTPQVVLIPRAGQTRWIDQGWWWPTVIAGLALVMLLALWWLLSQARRHRARRLSVRQTPGKSVSINDHALNNALTADLDTLPGVRRTQARLSGPPLRSQARITLTLDPDSAPKPVLKDLRDAVERARRSAGWDELPTRARLRVALHGPHRVE